MYVRLLCVNVFFFCFDFVFFGTTYVLNFKIVIKYATKKPCYSSRAL